MKTKISWFLNVPHNCCNVEIVVPQILESQLKLVLVKSDSPTLFLLPFYFTRKQFPFVMICSLMNLIFFFIKPLCVFIHLFNRKLLDVMLQVISPYLLPDNLACPIRILVSVRIGCGLRDKFKVFWFSYFTHTPSSFLICGFIL